MSQLNTMLGTARVPQPVARTVKKIAPAPLMIIEFNFRTGRFRKVNEVFSGSAADCATALPIEVSDIPMVNPCRS